MKVFSLRHHENNQDAYKTRYVGGLGDAKKEGRAVPLPLRQDILVEEVEVRTDKFGVLLMLNGTPEVGEPLRRWGLTARGALTGEAL